MGITWGTIFVWGFTIIIVVAFFLIITFSFHRYFEVFKKSKKLSQKGKEKFLKMLKKINISISSKEKIFDYDKLYHKILLEIGYDGNFGDILKQEPSVIDDLQKIWELHKLRNKLAHDFDIIEERILLKKSNEFKVEINKLLKNIS